MAAKKTSIALSTDDLKAARRAADAQGLSVSGLLSRLIRGHVAEQARLEAMDRYLEEAAPGIRLTREEAAAIEAELTAPLKPVRRRRKRRAA